MIEISARGISRGPVKVKTGPDSYIIELDLNCEQLMSALYWLKDARNVASVTTNGITIKAGAKR